MAKKTAPWKKYNPPSYRETSPPIEDYYGTTGIKSLMGDFGEWWKQNALEASASARKYNKKRLEEERGFAPVVSALTIESVPEESPLPSAASQAMTNIGDWYTESALKGSEAAREHNRRQAEETRGFDPSTLPPALAAATPVPVARDRRIEEMRGFDPNAMSPADVVVPPEQYAHERGRPAATPGGKEPPSTRGQWNKVVDYISSIPREDRAGDPTTSGQWDKVKKFAGQAVDAVGDYAMRPREASTPKEFDAMGAARGAGDALQEAIDFLTGGDVMGDKSASIWDLFGGGGEDTATPPASPTVPGDKSAIIRENAIAAAKAAEAGGAPAEDEAPVDPYDEAIQKMLLGEGENTFESALAQINKAYGGFDQYANPAQDKADAYAARENERTAALAQLALAGGLMSAAGGSWEKGATAFTNAAAVHSQGFERYQKALDDSAANYDKRMQRGQDIELAKRDAALSMWREGETTRRTTLKEMLQEKQQARKDRNAELRDVKKADLDHVDDVFKKAFDSNFAQSDTGEPPDPVKLNAFLQLWENSRRAGKVLLPPDMQVTSADLSD